MKLDFNLLLLFIGHAGVQKKQTKKSRHLIPETCKIKLFLPYFVYKQTLSESYRYIFYFEMS